MFFDIGANVGFYTLLASRVVVDGGRVYAFEPLPRNLVYLRKHIALNHRKNIEVVACALGGTEGTAKMNAATGPSAASIVAGGDGSVDVPIQSLDKLVAVGGVRLPSVIKMDVEGFEMPVLRGAAAVIKTARPSIVLSAHGWKNRDDCTRYLEGMGYRITMIHADEHAGDYGLLAKPDQGISKPTIGE